MFLYINSKKKARIYKTVAQRGCSAYLLSGGLTLFKNAKIPNKKSSTRCLIKRGVKVYRPLLIYAYNFRLNASNFRLVDIKITCL